jgi:DNA-binding MarR family transcriptional regulator
MKNIENSTDKHYTAYASLRVLGRALTESRRKELVKYGITPTQAGILFIIRALGEKAMPAEIARAALRKPHTISHILSKLEQMGLVEKHKDLDKANYVRISLAPKGKQISKNAETRESIHRIFSGFTTEELNQIIQLSDKLLFAINNEYQLGVESIERLTQFQQQWLYNDTDRTSDDSENETD